MRRRKRSGYRPMLTLRPHEWMPLDEAFACILASVASSTLAVRDLHRDLCSGQLGSAIRGLSYDGKHELSAVLEPSYWSDAILTVGPNNPKHVCILVPRRPDGIHLFYFFVRRRDVGKLYFATTPSPAPQSGPKPGSAAAWIDELYPNSEWRLMTGKQVHYGIARDAKKRELKKWPSYRAVLLELKRRRT